MNVITLGCLACRRQTDTLLAISDRGWENEWSKVTPALLLMSTAPVAHSNTTDWSMSGSCWMPQEQSPYSQVDFLESHSILPVTAVHAHAHTHTRKEQDHQLLQMSVDKEAELEKGKLQSCCCCSNKLISSWKWEVKFIPKLALCCHWLRIVIYVLPTRVSHSTLSGCVHRWIRVSEV